MDLLTLEGGDEVVQQDFEVVPPVPVRYDDGHPVARYARGRPPLPAHPDVTVQLVYDVNVDGDVQVDVSGVTNWRRKNKQKKKSKKPRLIHMYKHINIQIHIHIYRPNNTLLDIRRNNYTHL